MLSIDEAIAKYKEITENAICSGYCNISCEQCVKESEQLVKWLEELKILRLNNGMIHLLERLQLVENGYNKAIDDFVEKVELKYLGVHPDELYDQYYPMDICMQIKEMAEQLKGGAGSGTDSQ